MNILIRSSAKEKRLDIFEIKDSGKKLIAKVMDDFILEGPCSLPIKMAVKNSRGKVIGYVETFYPKRDEIQVQNSKGSIISKLEKGKDFVEKKKGILGRLKRYLFKKVSRDQLLFEKEIGTTVKCSYQFEKTEVYCFEKKDEIAGIIQGEEGSFLEYLPLILQRRIWHQEMVKTLLAKKS